MTKIELNEDYSWRNHSTEELHQYYFGIEPLTNSDYDYHFRYIRTGQIIDLISIDGIEFSGKLLNEITEYKSVKTEYGGDIVPGNYLYEVLELDKKKSSEVGQYILKQETYSFPTDSLVTGWSFDWLDCFGIDLNYKVKDNLYLKSYTCPWNQKDSVSYVPEIKSTYQFINKTLELDSAYSDFTDKLEKGKSYSRDGFMIMYLLTDKQIEIREKGKPQRDYLESIKDTIDDYLEKELNRLIPNSTKLNCYDDYDLTFSKKGKLKRLKVDMGFWERISDKEYKNCRRILKKVFRKIKIDFVDPKYEFYRGLTFGQKEIYITDPTIY